MLSLEEFVSGFDDIHYLSSEGSYEELRQYLQNDPAAAHRHNQNGLVPIHQIVHRDSDDVIQFLDLLLHYHADVNARTVVEGDTALHLAVQTLPHHKTAAIVRKLIMHGANPRIRNEKGLSAFDEAVARGYTDIADLLNSDRWIRDPEALVTAVCSGTLSEINRCLRLGCNVNKKTEVGSTPLHYVITHRITQDKFQALKILINNNADVQALTRDGDTVLTLAINYLEHDGELLSIVRYLLSKGVNKNIKNKSQKTAKDLAKEEGYLDVVELLENSGNDNDKSSSRAYGRWFKAVEASRTHEIRQFGQETDDKSQIYNNDGLTPLHVCVNEAYHKQQTTMIPALLVAGIDINAQTKREGNTALHLTAIHNNHLAAEQLLRHDCDAKIRNKKGQTAVDVCEELGHQKVKALIIAKRSGSKSCHIL